jgi:VWFA-related protein
MAPIPHAFSADDMSNARWLDSQYDSILASTMRLQALADLTGGRALVNTNDNAPGFKRIVEDNTRDYLLGYASTTRADKGVFRKLDVRVKRQGLTVRARKGFVRW